MVEFVIVHMRIELCDKWCLRNPCESRVPVVLPW